MSQTPLNRPGQEAIEWMVRLRAATPDAQLQAGFDAWLASDPAHAAAWKHLQQGLGGHYETLRSFERRAPGQAREVLLQPATSRRDVLRGLAGLGLFGGGLWLAARSQPGQALLADLRTGTGERRLYSLADGSQLNLNAGSAVDLDFSTNQRLLHLRRGELVVQVAAEPSRPFIVRSAQGDVRALGTRFLVRQEDQATRVLVLEHSVRISLPNGASQDLQEGEAALLHARHIEALGRGEQHRADWLQGQLSVLDEPLEAMIDALRPYRAGMIRVAPAVRSLRVQGVFPLDQPERALTALGETLPIRISHYGPWLTLIDAQH
ncbi:MULTISPECIES: FecR family protein [unclassified Pseudomonas]|uniref:FecR family protein n=1 Tax=unclassified Pseudomonas TaxID=196821 RepID=UPI00244AE4D2|nr:MULTISPECIES: FecR family protein [unclassified Pseudomonas]MDG9923467.1 FecR family protein [Pseudomonas sp. GD04045]MDH0035409.1 FecR family protein [Pseudomonas sp. GD04019]